MELNYDKKFKAIDRLKILDEELAKLNEQIEIVKYGDEILNKHLEFKLENESEEDEVLAIIKIESENPYLSKLRNYYFDELEIIQNKMRLITNEIKHLIENEIKDIKTLSNADQKLVLFYKNINLKEITEISFNGLEIK